MKASPQKAGTAMVTGASSGIGAVYADRLARRGHDLVLVARDQRRLEEKAAHIRQEYGVEVDILPADLTNRDDVAQVIAHLTDNPAVSILVNNAGVGPSAPVLASQQGTLETLIELNVSALHKLCVAAAHVLQSRPGAAIINVASVVALMPERFNASYAASKAFVLALSQGLAVELAPLGVRVQAVLPGFTRTEIFERAGVEISTLPQDMIMSAGDLVDAALAGFDMGEVVTIPPLADLTLWTDLERQRQALAPQLSRATPADRYKAPQAA